MSIRSIHHVGGFARQAPFASIACNLTPVRSSSSSSVATEAALPNEHQTLKLSNGRQLGFAEYGSPTGRPLLYFHGYPASRREPLPLHEELAKKNIRLLSIERPGLGLSTYQVNRQLTDWADDMTEFANGLGLQRYAVLGASGGGPYAIACAKRIPKEMLYATGVFSGAPSWSLHAESISGSRKRLAYLANQWPRFLRCIMAPAVWLTRFLMNRAWFQRRVDSWLETVMKRSNEITGTSWEKLSPEEMGKIREQTFAATFDHFEQGTAGFLRETQILTQPWGFEFGDVKGKVWMYHGTKDSNAPIEMMRPSAESLGNCKLQEFPEDDHYTMGAYMIKAMEKLVGDDVDRRVDVEKNE